MRRGRRLLLPALLVSAAGCLDRLPLAGGKEPETPAVTLGYGVDTSDADTRAIVGLVRDYFAHPDSAQRPRALWSTRDPFDARHGDIAADFVYDGGVRSPITIAGVVSAGPGDSVYVVKLLHASADERRKVYPLALQRVYAIAAPGTPHGWQLSNALPRHTAGWARLDTGRFTFHYAPGRTPSPARAARTARWTDSIAREFEVTPPAHIDYYVAAGTDEYFRALGLDFWVLPSGKGSGIGGNAMTRQGIVLAGDPAQAEEYRHEIVHTLLYDRFGGGAILGEGLATWLGGSKGRDRGVMLAVLAEYQRANPKVTLAELVRGETGGEWGNDETDALYASGVRFVDDVHRRGGITALRAMTGTPSEADSLLAAMRQRLGLGADSVALERWWRGSR